VITILTEWYIDTSEARQAEYVEALRLNCENPHVEAVWLCGTPPALAVAPTHPKIVLWNGGGRMTFKAFFDLASDELAAKLCAVMNADCYLDETAVLLDEINMQGRALCLTRWDVLPGGELRFVDNAGSQDAWIFLPPVRLTAPFFLGIAACDKRVAWLLKRQAGLVLGNPSLSLRVCHLHASAKRNYDPRKRLPAPHLCVQPTLLVGSEPDEVLLWEVSHASMAHASY
jgi:hypothetical protein